MKGAGNGADKRMFFSRSADRSLEAYQTWIRGVTAHLGGTDDLNDAEWEAAWRQFWDTAAEERPAEIAGLTEDDMEQPATGLQLTARFTRALDYARAVHCESRTGTQVPYLAHLLGVASLVMGENGYLSFPVTEDICIAALLHDMVEDHGGWPRLHQIEREFGADVAAIVEECSDTFVADRAHKEEWAARKAAYLERLRQASPAALLVSAGDKLHNARAILDDYRAVGAQVWSRFKGSREQVLENYRRLIEEYKAAGPNRIVAELERVVTELDRVSASR